MYCRLNVCPNLWHLIFRDPCILWRFPRTEQVNFFLPSFLPSFSQYLLNTFCNEHRFLPMFSISEGTTAPPLSVHGVQGRLTPPTSSCPYRDAFSQAQPSFRNGYLTQTKLMRAPPAPRAFVGTVRRRQPLISGLSCLELLVPLIASPWREPAWEWSQRRRKHNGKMERKEVLVTSSVHLYPGTSEGLHFTTGFLLYEPTKSA